MHLRLFPRARSPYERINKYPILLQVNSPVFIFVSREIFDSRFYVLSSSSRIAFRDEAEIARVLSSFMISAFKRLNVTVVSYLFIKVSVIYYHVRVDDGTHASNQQVSFATNTDRFQERVI